MEQRHVWIVMDDGTRLAARLFLPAELPAPVILEALPYRMDDLTSSYSSEYERLCEEGGFVVCRLDIRGTGSSEGIAMDEYHPQEHADICETITGQDDEGNTYTVTYTGVLAGTYDPGTGQFEGTVEISGTAPPGYEAAIPTVTLWDGGVVVSSGGCADSQVECAFGATQPVVDVYWEMPLPVDAIDPTYLGGTG